MKGTIAFWKREYQSKYYVLWAIIEKYEKQDIIEDILGIIIPETKNMFDCEIIATKAIMIAEERIKALEEMGFYLSEEAVIGHDGTKYGAYYVREV